MSSIEHDPTSRTAAEQSIGGLLSHLTSQVSALVRKEMELARAEAGEAVSSAIGGAAMLAVGGLVAFAGLLVLLDAAVLGLAALLPGSPLWVPALIVAAIVLGVGVVMLLAGRSRLKTRNLMPTRTVSSVKQDVQLAKEQIR